MRPILPVVCGLALLAFSLAGVHVAMGLDPTLMFAALTPGSLIRPLSVLGQKLWSNVT